MARQQETKRVGGSPMVRDCLLAIEKALKRAVDGNVTSRQNGGSITEYEFASAGAPEMTVIQAVMRNLVRAACGADKGTTKLPTSDGEVVVDASSELPVRAFADVLHGTALDFDALPRDDAAVAALAEATYMRYLPRSAPRTTLAVSSFPHCFIPQDCTSRIDVAVAGHVVLSLRTMHETVRVMRVFAGVLETIFGGMCDVGFATKVLPKSWASLSTLKPSQLGELLEDAQLAIAEYWADSPQDAHTRSEVTFLLFTVGTGVRHYFAAKLRDAGGVFRGNKALVEQAEHSCEDWLAACVRLTTIDWGAAWGGARFADWALEQVIHRLHTALGLRALLEEVKELLGLSEFGAVRVDALWDCFAEVDLFATDAASEAGWQGGLQAFDRRLQSVEHRCASRLRDVFAGAVAGAPQAALMQFSRFAQLVRRPIIARALIAEREGVLAQLNERLQSIQLEFEHRAESTESDAVLQEEDRRCQAGRFLPGVVNHMIWLRQLRGRVAAMGTMCGAVLGDLPAAPAFVSAAEKLGEQVTDYEQECFRNWAMEVEGQREELTLDANAPLMEINLAGQVEVNFPARLVQLLKEVRVFSELGYRVPPAIVQMTRQGEQLYSRGVALQHVATVYNTMSDEIIPTTRAMLLGPAVAFEKVITASGASRLTWRSATEADRFIDRLRNAAASLVDDNRRLHRLHREIMGIVLELFQIDLLRSRERWLGRVRVIREKIDTAGFDNTTAWRQFWDAQLYKALECQYRRGLERLHETLSEIKADVVCDRDTCQAVLRPSLESIRQLYYQRIRDFITLPIRFQGCGGGQALFQEMPARNEQGVYAVMRNAAQLFRRVQHELKRFTPMLIVGRCGLAGNASLEAIVGQTLTEVQHWEQSIRMLKQKGKEINAEELFIRCGCITLCTAHIKGTVEEHLARLTEALKVTLRHSAEQHLDHINGYLDRVGMCLDRKVTKLDEIDQANLHYAELVEERAGMEVEFHHFNNKNLLLQNMTGTPGLGFAKTKTRWLLLMQRLESHEKEVEEQLGQLKASVQDRAREWQKQVERFANQWQELKPKSLNAKDALAFVKEKAIALQVLRETGDECHRQCAYFDMDELDTHAMDELQQDLDAALQTWTLLDEFKTGVVTLSAEPWVAFRAKLYQFEDFVKLWVDKLKGLPPSPMAVDVRTMLDQWSRCAPLLKFVRGDGFTTTHWGELTALLGLSRGSPDAITFGDILNKHERIVQNEAALKKLHSRAQGEAQIREALNDVRLWASDARFVLIPHPDRPNVVLISDWKDTLSALSDNQALLMSMKESPYFALFASDANRWEERLATLDDYLRHMNQIQRKWVYLEPIFHRGALPNEAQRFDRIDQQYLQIMNTVRADSHLLALASRMEYKIMLRNVLEQLERCQKSLNQYLETKRDRFPRFYFISDDDLLEILAQGQNPAVIQAHLKKLFAGIHRVQFDTAKEHILRVYSLEGEVVTLTRPVRVSGEVETWLAALDKELKATLQAHLWQCVQKVDIGAYASQIICVAEMINFTRRTEEALRGGVSSAVPLLRQHKDNLQAQLRELTVYAGSNTDALIGLKLKALIMDLIHNIAVVELLIENNVTKETDWLWRRQLRYYLEEEKDNNHVCALRMVDARFVYSYEYQGNAPKLVHTPLTDRCYLTLTQGMQLGYGGNPYGPAGTGKTESVKALGNAMGRQVLVFNCDEGIDFKSMGRIFTGLVKCGAWGCFDEFNRLKIDQLSAISQMIQVIQEALKNGDRECHLLGRNIDVNANAGIFVTLNPAGKGYGGRTKLPDNLKQLFRSIAMSAPDDELITESILFSEGFEHAKELARRTVEIFRLSAQLLSSQQHYDWGLRAMKTVLRLGGVLIHDYLMARVAGKVQATSEEVLRTESEIIIKSLRVNTLSKLTFDDAVLFNQLVRDVFPDVAVREIDYGALRNAIDEATRELGLQPIGSQVKKVLQLYEALRQRMGVVLVGPSGSGKSTLLKILRKAMQRLGKTMPLYVVNPKALPREQLLGHMDPDTREWFDGVLTDAARKVVKESAEVHSWVLCDGDIDPEWVESLNSVLDDNKLLTMPNGVRIQFGDNVNFLFETHSLQYASPATVSRMGIIYLSEEDVDPQSAVATWLAAQPEEIRGQLTSWIEAYFYKAVDALLATGQVMVETTKMGLVSSGLSQLQGCTSKAQFALGLVYGLGSYLPEESRKDFVKEMLYLTGERAPDAKHPLDFRYDPDRGGYVSFDFEPPLDLTVDDLYRHPMVATVDCQRALEVMRAWSRPVRSAKAAPYYRPFILVGPEGCGKAMLLSNLFAQASATRVATVNCSAQTRAEHVIQKLQQTCQVFHTNNGKVLRPKEAECLVLLLKDLNLPKPDKYGTVQLHSLLQQLILYRGFYDSDLEWVTIERVQIVASMNPPGSMGRHPVSPRLLAITSVLCLSYPTRESLQLVYTEFLNIMLQSQRLRHNLPGKGAADIARVMTSVYEVLSTQYTVDTASHYTFNPRDLTRWTLNLLHYNTNELGDAVGYEGRRIFVDRLVTSEERTKLARIMRDSLSAMLGLRSASAEKESVYYVSWADEAAAPGGATGRRLTATTPDELRRSTEQVLLAYSRENAELDMQLLPEVCAWVARVDRVLSQERGNLLLVGRAGVCASEVVRLVAYRNRLEVVTLGITRDYALKQFYAELKAVLLRAGVDGQSTVLLLEDFHFFHDGFLEVVNSLLSSGEVAGLLTHDEQEALLAPLKADAATAGLSPYVYFVDRVVRHLHVVVVMDYTNPLYEPRCRANPALFTRCNVYWMGNWEPASLKLVPRLLFPADAVAGLTGEKGEVQLTAELVQLHRLRGSQCAPQQFKVLCRTYARLFAQRSSQVAESLGRLGSGVAKLDEAQGSVDKIAADVASKKALLEVRQKEADEALAQIQANMAQAGEQKRGIHKIQKELDKEQAAIQERKSVIEGQLSGIQPILDAARSAVSLIRAEHLAELKSMKQPPVAVQDVLEGVILLINGGVKKEDSSWATVRKVLAGDIKSQILNYDIDQVSTTARTEVERFIAGKSASFKREVIGRASKAAAPMAEWLRAVVEYSKVLETVAPMRAELREYEDNLQRGQKKKATYEDKLRQVERVVNELKTSFGAKTTEAERLKDELERAEQLLRNATDLIAKLGSEHARWTAQTRRIEADRQLLPKRCLLAAAFITYLGNDDEAARRATLEEWKTRLQLPDFNFFTFLREESMQLHYKSEGLPADELSMDNAVLIQEQGLTPLIEDPSGQALNWLVRHLQARKDVVEVCGIADERLVSALELALRFGKKFIITDVDRIEPFLYPILRKELRNEGVKHVIQIGDRRTVDYADGFQLYLVTRSSELRVAPDIAAHLTFVSFSITQSGLEGQFLGITIQHEQPELEREKVATLQKEEELKLRLGTLEERLLSELASSQGSLLENISLIASLNEIKSQASEIAEALAKSAQVQEEIDTKRNVYRPFAQTASVVFFATKGLKELLHMYQFSFRLFMDLFHRTLRTHTELRTDPETKIAALQETFVQLTVASVSRALLKEHRVVFGIALARALYPHECSSAEWDFFLDRGAPIAEAARVAVRVPSFVLPDSVDTFRVFAVLFPELVTQLRLQEADVWLQWMRSSTPELHYPAFLRSLTQFQHLLLMKTLRPDRLSAAMNLVACQLLKVDSLAEGGNLASLLTGHDDAATPVLLITTTGADPSLEVQAIAHEQVGKEHFHQLAMGGGQTEEALRLLRGCAESGDWLFLKNLHLVIPWVAALQKELGLLKPHRNFRLLCTTEAHDEFPSILLAQSLKITFEAPPGVRQNMLRTYASWGKAYYESKTSTQRELLFIAAALHAIVQERRSYVPQGWTKAYEITAADLNAVSDIVLRQSTHEIDWSAIRGLLENAIYGGKMETEYDVRILRTYIDHFFRPASLTTGTQQQQQQPLFQQVRVPGGHFAEVVKVIRHQLSSNDVPALFALPPNADRVVQQSRVRELVLDLQRIHEVKVQATMTKEEWAARLLPVLQSWTELTATHSDLLTHHTIVPHAAVAQGEVRPIERFIAAELASALRLVAAVDACVSDLRKVIDSAALLTEQRRLEAACLVAGDIPAAWEGHFPSNGRVMPWMQALLRRAVMISRWQGMAANGVLLRQPIDLSYLLRAKTFLNALRQETAHVVKKPLVSLRLVARTSTPPEAAPLPVALENLLLQGAIVDDDDLLQPIETADEPAVFMIRKTYVAWIESVTDEKAETTVRVPVYADASKAEHLCDFALPCASALAVEAFTLAGVSIMLEQ